jgi:DNA modification methylase
LATKTRKYVNQYLVADARKLASRLPSRPFIDVTITSPPYWDLKDYGVKKQIGYGQSYSAYLDDIEAVFKQVFDRTKETGSLWVVSDTLKQNGRLQLLPFDMAAKLEKCGWILQDVIIWHKDRTLPWSHQGKLRNIFEYITFFTKTPRFKYNVSEVRDLSDLKDYWVKYPERYSPEGKAPSRSWNFAIPRQGSWGTAANFVDHACPLPHGLVERIVALASDEQDFVFDPFAGSGTVLAVASATKRRYCGLDLSSKHKRLFVKTVLPTIQQKLKGNRTSGERLEKHRKAFSSTVEALRRLKLPREATRIYRNTHGPMECAAVLVAYSPEANLLKIGFVPSRRNGLGKTFAAAMRAICARPPLTKYGFTVRLVDLSGKSPKAQVRAMGWNQRDRLYRYDEGRFYSWTASLSVDEYLNLSGDAQVKRYPRIYSPIAVRVDPTNPDITRLGAE